MRRGQCFSARFGTRKGYHNLVLLLSALSSNQKVVMDMANDSFELGSLEKHSHILLYVVKDVTDV
jgi:hypothetical protein